MPKLALMTGIIIGIISVIILFSIMGNSATELERSADSISYPSNCSTYAADGSGTPLRLDPDVTTTNCTNSSNVDTSLPAEVYSMPLRTLFSSGGVVMLVLMAAFLLLMIGISFKLRKK